MEETIKENNNIENYYIVTRYMITRGKENEGELLVYGKESFSCWAGNLSAFEILECGFKNKANAKILFNKTADKENLTIKKFIIKVDATIPNYR